ncbi:MAG TPA: hypothetical protein VFK90_02465 [Anaeromyxobacter sp.]|nr:hypothetical protein [Anaeromyxobacter sp.]
MRGARMAAALAATAALVGCPIPQPLPDYAAGTAITPPRIVVDGITSGGTVVRVPAGCTTAPTFPLDAKIIDVNTIEPVVARWFVNYDPNDSARYSWEKEFTILGVSVNPPVTERQVPTYTFHPYDSFPTIENTGGGTGKNVGAVHIVELVVSNGFDPNANDNPPSALPNRTPSPGFETQLYRWMFLTVPESPAGCTAGDPGCVRCP